MRRKGNELKPGTGERKGGLKSKGIETLYPPIFITQCLNMYRVQEEEMRAPVNQES
jgi:hypothetical protein